MKRFVFPLAVALCLLALVSEVSAKDTWISVRTKNFYLIGNANEKDIHKVCGEVGPLQESRDYVRPDRYGVLKGQFSNKIALDTVIEAKRLTAAEEANGGD